MHFNVCFFAKKEEKKTKNYDKKLSKQIIATFWRFFLFLLLLSQRKFIIFRSNNRKVNNFFFIFCYFCVSFCIAWQYNYVFNLFALVLYSVIGENETVLSLQLVNFVYLSISLCHYLSISNSGFLFCLLFKVRNKKMRMRMADVPL